MKYLYVYRNISVPATVISLLSCYTFWSYDSVTVLSILTWMKVITTGFLILYIHIFRTETIVFFMNLGIGIRRYYSSMFIIDMSAFVLLVVLTSFLK